MHPVLRFSFANCLTDRLGASPLGITPQEIDGLRPQAAKIHAAIVQRRATGGLEFLSLAQSRDITRRIIDYVRRKHDECDTYVNLGIGGSSLGAIALMGLRSPFHNELSVDRRGGMRCYFPENVDPRTFGALLDRLDPARTLFGVISKSGSTAETMAQYLIIRRWLTDRLGADRARRQLVFVTDPHKGFLRPIARQEKIDAFDIPPGVGGRFSVLCPVGLLPAACAGVDIDSLLEGAEVMAQACQSAVLEENPALKASVIQYRFYGKGARIHVIMPYFDALLGLARWCVQLISESLGKERRRDGENIHAGYTPVPAIGVTDQHSQVQLFMEGPFDKFVTLMALQRFECDVDIPPAPESLSDLDYLSGHRLGELLAHEQRATEMALTRRGRPNMKISMPEWNAHALGQLFCFFQLLTVYLGEWLDIDAFDQPGVELGKNYTYGLMGRQGYERQAAEVKDFFCGDE